MKTLGAIDLHFHGAFGIDLMTASKDQLNDLSKRLWKKGIAGFCPTTLSTTHQKLTQSVERLGHWIQEKNFPGAKPLGIHLEGPWIHPNRCGAHPSTQVRDFKFSELEELWTASQETLKIITLAPELLSTQQLKKLVEWCKPRKILLSAGHSQATQKEAQAAFQVGVQGITHAWNAMAYHHRDPGVMGAGIGNPQVYLELIIDQIHLSNSWIRWTRKLHPTDSICFISDCAPAGGQSKGAWHSFGPLKIQMKNGASRLPNGHLAGGGLLLTESYCRWLKSEAEELGIPIQIVLENSVHHLTMAPIRVLEIPIEFLADRQVSWQIQGPETVQVIPIDSKMRKR